MRRNIVCFGFLNNETVEKGSLNFILQKGEIIQ